MIRPTTQELRQAIEISWDALTSAAGEDWTEDNPALGQCAVTALVQQDYFGGELYRIEVNGESHYFHTQGDWTCQQFERIDTWSEYVKRDRGYVLGFIDTHRRYEILRLRVKLALLQSSLDR